MAISTKETEAQAGLKICPGQEEVTAKEEKGTLGSAHLYLGFPGGSAVKNPSANAGDTKRPGFDPCIGKNPWRRKWHPTPVFLPGKFHE